MYRFCSARFEKQEDGNTVIPEERLCRARTSNIRGETGRNLRGRCNCTLNHFLNFKSKGLHPSNEVFVYEQTMKANAIEHTRHKAIKRRNKVGLFYMWYGNLRLL